MTVIASEVVGWASLPTKTKKLLSLRALTKLMRGNPLKPTKPPNKAVFLLEQHNEQSHRSQKFIKNIRHH